MTSVLCDTGPIVALLNARDGHHSWARDAFAALKPPLATCEAVLAEACHLLRRIPGGATRVLDLVDRGVLNLPLRLCEETHNVRSLMARYADVPMSLADACLVRMAGLDRGAKILTLDSDFLVYRRDGRQALRILAPD